jgi:hypothetical protein
MAEEAIDSGLALDLLKRMAQMNGEPEKLERFL